MDVNPEVPANFETKLREEFFKLRDPVLSKVANAVMAKKNVQTYLDHVLKALKETQDTVERMKEENDAMVAELSSLMESNLLLSDLHSKDGDVLSHLIPLLDDCKPDDSLDVIKDKLKQSFQVCNI